MFFSSSGKKHLYISIRDRVGRGKLGCQFVLCYFFINTIPKLYDIVVQSLSHLRLFAASKTLDDFLKYLISPTITS